MISETKKIENFKSYKAIGEFRGRIYTVWYTLDIPINSGPWKLQGLPGLILSASDDKSEVIFNITSITKIDKPNLLLPKLDGERISIEEFSTLQKSLPINIFKKLSSKMPRGVKVEVTSEKGMEIFKD